MLEGGVPRGHCSILGTAGALPPLSCLPAWAPPSQDPQSTQANRLLWSQIPSPPLFFVRFRFYLFFFFFVTPFLLILKEFYGACWLWRWPHALHGKRSFHSAELQERWKGWAPGETRTPQGNRVVQTPDPALKANVSGPLIHASPPVLPLLSSHCLWFLSQCVRLGIDLTDSALQ